MKKNRKKVIIGFAMTMIFSLAIMQGNSQKNVQEQDVNLQQVCLGTAYIAGETEGGVQAVCYAVSAGSGVVAYQCMTGGAIFGWTPVGWAAVGVGALAGL